jgi:CysZ protein
MVGAIGKAIGQLFAPAFRSVLLKALALTAALLAVLMVGAQWGIDRIGQFEGDWAWANWGVDALVALGVLAASVFLIVPVAAVFIGFFLEDVATSVEVRHYPGAGLPREVGLGETIAVTARFLAVSLALNLLALPLYLVPGLNLILFVVLNGILVGREYFELVALRRLPRAEARRLRKAHAGRIFLAGVVIALALAVPLANLLAPLFGTAFMVHVFWKVAPDAPRV